MLSPGDEDEALADVAFVPPSSFCLRRRIGTGSFAELCLPMKSMTAGGGCS